MVPTRPCRPAFRLIEVLLTAFAVVLVVGLLIMLLGRASMDDGAPRCISNNKQLGLAVHEYAFAHQLTFCLVDL